MSTIQKAKKNIINKINKAVETRHGVSLQNLTLPPNPKMGDFSFACFSLSKELKKNPTEIAAELAKKIKPCQTVKEINAVGPYLNFTLQPKKLAKGVLQDVETTHWGVSKGVSEEAPRGVSTAKKSTIMVEFAHPNTHKSFHIGHLRNIITGEALCRILENSGYKIIRANYQGDVGMHIAKCLWGITKLEKEFEKLLNAETRYIASKGIDERVKFLAKAYVKGSKAYEEDKKAKAEIIELNKRIYDDDKSIRKIYKETRKWSLDYFAKIYKRLNTKFDRLYFESETFKPGKKIVMAGVKKNIFKASEGAIIFEGSKHGLHDRVFINSEGNPTYEAKDMALAKLQFSEFNPSKILHVTGKEQTEYFKVIIKALEYVLPKSKGKEEHLDYGWVSLKGGKMSSRLGKVVLGEDLLDSVNAEIKKIIKNNKGIKDKNTLAEKVSLAAVKFAFLKTGVNKDVAFDMSESVSLSGNSGPYILYTYARIKSIINKSKAESRKPKVDHNVNINNDEKKLLLKLALYPEITKAAADKYDPSIIAKYLFELAQDFNDYYHKVPVLKAEKEEKQFRLNLISAIAKTLQKGSELLGFETVEKM